MKLLLTSNGLSSPQIVDALKKWVDKDIHFAFIPTAANLTGNNKAWLIQNYVECRDLGYVDIVDISALDKEIWLPRLQKANVIVMGGGTTSHLIKHLHSSGLMDELPELLKTRIYVGISAGSIVTSKIINTASEFLYGDENAEVPPGLGYIDFNIRPHYKSLKHPNITDDSLKKAAQKLPGDIYALGDKSAVVYEDGKVTVVSDGEWKLFKTQ